MIYKLGKWYEAKGQVRAGYREYWKGILLKKNKVAVISISPVREGSITEIPLTRKLELSGMLGKERQAIRS